MKLIGPDSVWIWTAIQSIAVTVSLFFIMRQLRTQASSHVVTSLNLLSNKWNTPRILKARERVCRKYLDGKLEFHDSSEVLADFFEEVGVYQKLKAIPDNIIWESFSWFIEYYYTLLESGIIENRNKYKDQNLYECFSKLHKDMQRISKHKGSPTFQITKEELSEFALGEADYVKVILEEMNQ